jgi:uncharacterized protein DUF3303
MLLSRTPRCRSVLFVCTARHTAEMCPAGKVNPDKGFAAKAEKTISKAGGKFQGVWLDGPGHTFYMVIDVKDGNQLWDATEDFRVIGDVQSTPVVEFAKGMTQARKLGVQK